MTAPSSVRAPWIDAAAPAGSLRWWLQGSALLLGFTALYLSLSQISFFHWLIANGALFTAAWCLRARWWVWLGLGTILARMLHGAMVGEVTGETGPFLHYWPSWVQFVLGTVLEPALVLPGVILLRRFGLTPRHMVTPERMAQLHYGALLSGTLVALKDLGFVLSEGRVGDLRENHRVNFVELGGPHDIEILTSFGLSHLLGTFVAIMLIAPLALWLLQPDHRAGSGKILRSAWRMLLPLTCMYLLLVLRLPGSALADMLRLLLLTCVIVFAMRHGWRGAAVAVLAASVAVALEDHFTSIAAQPIRLQLFIAITGAMGLLFGVSMDNLRRQTAELRDAHLTSQQLHAELNAAAVRNLAAEERERRRLAADLHDEFGQNLTALQTHLKLAERDLLANGQLWLADKLLELTRSMRQNIAGVLEALRPAALDELGLFAAIDRGSVRRLAEDAGLEFDTRIEGDARLLSALGDTQRIAAYRLVQEAVTNVVRHAHAASCHVRLRISRRNGMLWLFLDVRDDGLGGAAHLRAGNGILNMRDRVTALGGRLHLQDLNPGLRVHTLLRDAGRA